VSLVIEREVEPITERQIDGPEHNLGAGRSRGRAVRVELTSADCPKHERAGERRSRQLVAALVDDGT
jgi:hypothetical protein